MRRRLLLPILALLATAGSVHAGYRVENVPLPSDVRGGISAVTFSPAGTLVIATRFGEVWMRSVSGGWRRFARGLNEPMGLIADSDQVVWLAHRPELLRAADTDRDGHADSFEALGAKWGISHNYHEFFYGLKRDRAGTFYGIAGLDSTSDKVPIKPTEVRGQLDDRILLGATNHRSELPWRGWAIAISADGQFRPIASGFRQANGVGLSPTGEIFVTDNQGDYKPSCGLLHVAPGDFHGHVSSLKWEPSGRPEALTLESAWQRYKSPAVVFPHGPMGVSAGEPVWDTTEGKFGPFAGQVFTGDFTRLVIRSSLELVAGGWQGACFPFLGRNESAPAASGEKLLAGVMRAAFAPDGSLYLGATGGWGGGADGLQRVVWDGVAPAEIRDIKLTEKGFALTFTQPMDSATLSRASRFELNRFRYYYQAKYGSPWVDEAKVAIREIRVQADGLGVELLVEDLQPGYVYEFSVAGLRTAQQEALVNPLAYYTANRLQTGERTTGGTTRLPQPGETSLGAKDADSKTSASPERLIAEGEKTYRLYCAPCHQPDGRGIPGGAANFLEDKSRLAKPDAELLKVIAGGVETKGMPAFEAILSPLQRRAALMYIRATFGEKLPKP